MKRKSTAINFMTIGIVLILSALFLLVYNYIQSQKASDFAAEAIEKIIVSEDADSSADNLTQDMKVVIIDGYGYVGYIEIPKIDRTLPVMATCDDRRLKLAPCRYSGSTFTNDLVIAAHNYRTQFGPIGRLREDDKVYFTDMDGIRTEYTVQSVRQLSPFAVDEMTAGNYDLTLFTCTLSGRMRTTVGCMRTQDNKGATNN